MSILELLRSASLGGHDLIFLNEDDKIVEFEKATKVQVEDSKFNLSQDSGYKTYSAMTIVYFYLSKSVDHQNYLSSVFEIAHSTAVPLDPISMLDRKDILDYLTGVTSTCVGVSPVKVEQKRTKYLTVIKNKKFTAFVRNRERGSRNSNTVLLAKPGRGFNGIRETAAAFISLKKKEKAGSNATAPKATPKMEFVPLIVIPSAVQSLITMYNVKDLLQFQKFIPGETYRSQGMNKPVSVYIERDASKIGAKLPVKYQVIDSVDKLKPTDWYRVLFNFRGRIVAVFALGQEWQFKGWKWKQPVEIFNSGKFLKLTIKCADFH
jgi:parafibromin